MSLNSFIEKLGVSENKKKIIRNLYWALLGKTINILSALFVGIIIARYLGPEQYGIMNYVISFVTIFSILANFGLDNIEIRELSIERFSKELLIGTAFRLKIIFSCCTIIIIAIFLFFFETDNNISLLILIYSISSIFMSFNVIRNYFTSIVLNEYVVKTEILRTIIGVALKIILLLFQVSLIWFIIAMTLDFLWIAGGYLIAYKKKVGNIIAWKYNKSVAKYLIKESFPLLLSGAAVILYQRIDQVMIGNMIDKEAVGFFSVAGKFTELIIFLPLIMAQTITPLLIRIRERSVEEYLIKSKQFVNIVVWSTILISIFVSIMSYWIIKFTFGDKYLEAVPVLQILVFKAVGMALSSSSGQLIIIQHIQKWAYIRNFIGVFICVIFNLWFIPIYGIIGSAYASIITVSFTACLANIFIPPYYSILKLQLYAVFLGWKDLFIIKKIFK